MKSTEETGGWEKLEIFARYSSTEAFNWGETSAQGKEEGAGGAEKREQKKERERRDGGRREEGGRDALVEGCRGCRYTLRSGGR